MGISEGRWFGSGKYTLSTGETIVYSSRDDDVHQHNQIMIIKGMLFPHKEIHKQTRISPDGRTRNQIAHILIIRKFGTSVLDTRVLRSADIASDHNLVCTRVKLKVKAAPSSHIPRGTRFDTQKLGNDGLRRPFRLELRN